MAKFLSNDDNNPNLVSAWPMKEGTGSTITDIKGTNTGTISGATWVKDKGFSRLSFDGVNDYVSVPNNDSLNFGTTGDFTVSVWIKAAPISRLVFIVSKEDPELNKRYNFYLRTTVPYIQYIVTDDAGHEINFNNDLTNRADDNNWHLLSATTDRDSAIGGKLYLDGVLLNTVNVTSLTGTLTNTNPLTIGMRSGNNSAFFPGLIDDVRVYNAALTQQQVTTLYQNGLITHQN
jgi:hypothetical protein